MRKQLLLLTAFVFTTLLLSAQVKKAPDRKEGREQTPEDIGHLAAFLSSPAGWNITGQAIAVDGGITLR